LGTLLFEKSKGRPLLSAIALQFETLAHTREIKRWQRNLNAMDSIPKNRPVSRKLKGVQMVERWVFIMM